MAGKKTEVELMRGVGGESHLFIHITNKNE